MPEMRFHIRWPDGTRDACYSPSLIIKDHLAVGQDYPVADFVALSRLALGIASERVRSQYGFPCGRAQAQIDRIEETARRQGAGTVYVESFEE
ncbi:MSMEG_0570 family nitrogen starvation response protein [Methylobacterium sp. J-070]|uniref:MSMEG_0570 family nitrogen starvation response protein n=1 Tax=Methylobacterium sp. J-070 TaxID=2836650 RepID=UPI001FB9D07B|nr:MSMEG_0570 family nitrogen starvation response protein [Methylobacterium sp. J-070]MCJ2051350.1 MSMEG_0570 family nitrogen starvation response protein [Methylobacterium sp. J-070]